MDVCQRRADKDIDLSQQMRGRDAPFQMKRIEELRLISPLPPHH
jgi:hypothetical protein